MRQIFDYIVNVVIVLVLLVAGEYVFSETKTIYYTYADIDNFYVTESFQADDVCFGTTEQKITSKRFVYGTDTGYGAEVIKEMYLLHDDTIIKVYDESTMPFIEVVEDGTVHRIQNIPSTLALGEYEWVLYVKIYIYGVERSDITPLKDTFKIIDCE